MAGGPLTVEQALTAIRERVRPLAATTVDLADALHRVLAEPVAADLDSPPFDKALVDGFAVRSADLTGPGPVTLRIAAELFAGQARSEPVEPGTCVSIMTGAPLPPGADSVVMHERTVRLGPDRVTIPTPVPSGQNRFLRGREMRAGDVVLEPGQTLNAAALGLLAAVGRTQVPIRPAPTVAVVPTGDELVEPGQVPGPGQIRNTNALTLATLIRSLGYPARPEPIVRDRAEALRLRFRELLEGTAVSPPVSVLIVSGGVSAGKLDLVPAAFEAVGVEPVFHKVRIKPGQPLWFGVGQARPGLGRALVFGLPGNPVSGVVNVLRFVGPALDVLAGQPSPALDLPLAVLAEPFRHQGDRPTYHPVTVDDLPDGRRQIRPLAWAGSPDLRALARAQGFAAFPAGDHEHPAGSLVPLLAWPGRV